MLHRVIDDGAVLRALEPWRAAEFAALTERIREHLRPWLPWATTVVDEDSARELLQGYADATARDGKRIFGLWVDGELVGGVLARVFDLEASVCEVGVWIAPECEGKGLINRAVTALIDWAILERGIARVEWWAVPANTRSLAAAGRLGFAREGRLRQIFPVNGVRHDAEVWSVLADEWRRHRGMREPA